MPKSPPRWLKYVELSWLAKERLKDLREKGIDRGRQLKRRKSWAFEQVPIEFPPDYQEPEVFARERFEKEKAEGDW